MMGVGPAAQIAAYQAAGVRMRRLAAVFGLAPEQISALVLGFRLHEARSVDPDLRLAANPVTCMIVGCDRPVDRRQLCTGHVFKLYQGGTLLRAPARVVRIKVGRCVTCGVTWCNLRWSQRRTCGDLACRMKRAARPSDPRILARNAEILDRVRAGELYRVIAADYGISDRRVTQIANGGGLFRYSPRPGSRRGLE